MKINTRQPVKYQGSALILVVVVSVLLAVIGVMFLMISRAGEAETAAVVQSEELNAAVDTVVHRINQVLVQDLFGFNIKRPRLFDANSLNADADEQYDFAIHNPGLNAGGLPFNPGPDNTNWTPDDEPIAGTFDDYWLASLEPVFVNAGLDGTKNTNDDRYEWPHITDLWGTLQVMPDSIYNQMYYTPPVFWIDPDNDSVPTQWQGTWNFYKVSANNVRLKVVSPKDRVNVIRQFAPANVSSWNDKNYTAPFGARADADGDGVADSRWVQIPNLVTNRGEPVFAAVRIIDNCAMLNLNAASCFDQGLYDNNKKSPFVEEWKLRDYSVNPFVQYPWHSNIGSGTGRYLTEINYLPLLRGKDLNGNYFAGTQGGDFWDNLLVAKNFAYKPEMSQLVMMQIESLAGTGFHLFDIADELELRNRYLVTSRTEARFEHPSVANFTLDSGSTDYQALQVPRKKNTDQIDIWYQRIDPGNFDFWAINGQAASGTIPYKYDRRHISTFYSFDRNLRIGRYPVLEAELALVPAAYREQIRSMLIPKGAVTIDITSPKEMPSGRPYNNAETRKRILQLLYAFREYYMGQGDTKNEAALKAAQVVANLIDFSDDDATHPTSVNRQGPFYNVYNSTETTILYDYGTQANLNCTFITKTIIDRMIVEVRTALRLPAFTLDFGLAATDIVFGYERQPFISEVYARHNTSSGAFEAFAVELLNPYSGDIDLTRNDNSYLLTEDGWRIKVGDGIVIDQVITNSFNYVPAYQTFASDPNSNSPGRYVLSWNTSNASTGRLTPLTFPMPLFSQMGTLQAGNCDIQLLRPAPPNSGYSYICVDKVSSADVRRLFQARGENAVKRDDTQWRFIYPDYVPQTGPAYTNTLGQANAVSLPSLQGFQLAVADDEPLQRWHELETLSALGNGPDTDPNSAITYKLTDPNAVGHLDLVSASGQSGLLDYICTMNREIGSLPGRININTAPMHVIACAIPPSLADQAVATGNPVTFSALQLAKAIVAYRTANGPYKKVSDLLNVWVDFNANATADADEYIFLRYYTGGISAAENVGNQGIDDDIEERDWILSNLANKFTVRSDTFTAYILVRLGQKGPQRRMIAIFDRSNVWAKNDLPKLVALHPVPAGESQ